MAYWACAQVAPQQERAAQHFLGLAGYQTYLPRLRLERRSHGRRIVTKPPLFPSYVFVAIVSGWWAARWCPHVVRLILNGATPAVVADSVIDEIRSRERGGLVELPKPAGFNPGDRVRVLAGPLQGRLGLYAGQRPHERVLVLLALLGGEQRVKLAKKDMLTRSARSANSSNGALWVSGCRSEWRKIAKPDKQVIVAHGDGSFGLNALELDTAVRHNIPILVVVSLSGGWTADPERNKPGRNLSTAPR